MVSTPIGTTQRSDISNRITTTTSPRSQMSATPPQESTNPFLPNSATLMQPTLQPGLPYMSNLFPSQQSHSFPILYNGPFPPTTSTTSEVQPVSLYSEYFGNPYNTTSVPQNTITETPPLMETEIIVDSGVPTNDNSDTSHQIINSNIDMNRNSSINANNSIFIENNNSTIFFQSSNYFNSVPSSNVIPAGSEILFGVNVQTPNANIFVDNKESSATMTDV